MLFNQPIFLSVSEVRHGRSLVRCCSTEQNISRFHRSGAFPITQLTASKHKSDENDSR